MRQRRGMNFMGNSYMGWKKKGKGFLSRKGRKGREEDTFYLPLSTWRPWREGMFCFRGLECWVQGDEHLGGSSGFRAELVERDKWKVEEDFQFFHLPPSTCPLLLALG